jgi:hypothetical protein
LFVVSIVEFRPFMAPAGAVLASMNFSTVFTQRMLLLLCKQLQAPELGRLEGMVRVANLSLCRSCWVSWSSVYAAAVDDDQ